MSDRRPLFTFLLALAPAASATPRLSAQSYRVETLPAPPPVEAPAGVRAVLSPQGVRVVGPSGAYLELWFRKTIPAAKAPNALGIAYPQLVPGTLLGLARFSSGAKDYRNRAVPAGLYTLRYQLHPVDGNHMGVAPQRDFVLLAPAAEDATPDRKSLDDLMALSRKASGSTHPSVWSLVKPDDPPSGPLPALVHREGEQLWVLYATVTIQPEGGAEAQIPLALIVVGHAPEA